MYWYAIKRLVIEEAENLKFGNTIDAQMADAYSYPSPVPTCCAAWAYRMDRIKSGLQYVGEHNAPTLDDIDNMYYLEDMEMEERIINNRA